MKKLCIFLFTTLSSAVSAGRRRHGLGHGCGRIRRCQSHLRCEKSPIIKRCVPHAGSWPSQSRNIGENCYDASDCKGTPGMTVECTGSKRYNKTCKPLYTIDVRGCGHGEVFACPCNTNNALGGRLITKSSDNKARFDTKYVARFSVNNQCYCAVVDDLYRGWDPSDGGEGGTKGYSTQCVGMCGAQCGKDGRGLFDQRWEALIIHDVCQAWIGSTDGYFIDGGRFNECGDEADGPARGIAVKELFKIGTNNCKDGDFISEDEMKERLEAAGKAGYHSTADSPFPDYSNHQHHVCGNR